MNSEKLGTWLTLVANIGVVIGLALLIYELRLGQKLAETAATVRRYDQIQLALLEMATSDSLPAIRVKALSDGMDTLSAVELYRLRLWEDSVRLRMSSQYVEYQRGYLDEDSARGIVQGAAGFLPYWESLGAEMGDSDFEQAIRAYQSGSNRE